jgi:hypothetical protein
VLSFSIENISKEKNYLRIFFAVSIVIFLKKSCLIFLTKLKFTLIFGRKLYHRPYNKQQGIYGS